MTFGRGALIVAVIIGFLFLGIFLFRASDYQSDILRLNREYLVIEERMSTKAGNWINYLESRVNRVAQSQDEYQASTSSRIDFLEERIKRLEATVQKQEEQISSLNKRVNQSPK